MTLDGVYLRKIDSTKDPHWIPHFIPNKLLLQGIAYQTHINGVFASLIKSIKEAWPPFPLSTKVCRMENIKQTKEEFSVLSSFKFRERNFRRNDLECLLKRDVKINFIMAICTQEFFPEEISQQGILVKSKIPTPKEMMQI